MSHEELLLWMSGGAGGFYPGHCGAGVVDTKNLVKNILKRRSAWWEYARIYIRQNPQSNTNDIESAIYEKFGREWVRASFEVMIVAQEAQEAEGVDDNLKIYLLKDN